MASEETKFMTTKEMIKFWAIGVVALLITAAFTSVLFFGFVASIFGS